MYINRNLLIYPGFVIAILLVGAVFITATTYIQLSIGILLYPILAFFGYKVFLNGNTVTTHVQPHATPTEVVAKEQGKTHNNSTVSIADIDKRAFLKLIGATGISFFLISIFGQRIQSLLFGSPSLGQVGSKGDPQKTAATSSPTEGYNIAEVDDSVIGYYGFTNKEGAWFIMQGDTNSGSFRYARGGSNFPDNWKRRETLTYDYFSAVFP